MFVFSLFLEARAEISLKNFIGILVETMTPKGHFEINWPLAESAAPISQFFNFSWLPILVQNIC